MQTETAGVRVGVVIQRRGLRVRLRSNYGISHHSRVEEEYHADSSGGNLDRLERNIGAINRDGAAVHLGVPAREPRVRYHEVPGAGHFEIEGHPVRLD